MQHRCAVALFQCKHTVTTTLRQSIARECCADHHSRLVLAQIQPSYLAPLLLDLQRSAAKVLSQHTLLLYPDKTRGSARHGRLQMCVDTRDTLGPAQEPLEDSALSRCAQTQLQAVTGSALHTPGGPHSQRLSSRLLPRLNESAVSNADAARKENVRLGMWRSLLAAVEVGLQVQDGGHLGLMHRLGHCRLKVEDGGPLGTIVLNHQAA